MTIYTHELTAIDPTYIVCPYLNRFACEVLSEFNQLKLGTTDKLERSERDGVSRTSYWAYYEDHVLPLGKIGYGSYMKTVEDKVYMVQSETIENPRYTDYDRLFHMKFTKSQEKGVSSAKKYLRRRPDDVIAKAVFADDAEDEFVGATQDIKRNHGHASRALSHDNDVVMELLNIAKSGYKFSDPVVADRVAAVINADITMQEDRSSRPDKIAYVHITEHGCTVATVDRHANRHNVLSSVKTTWETQRYNADELPDNYKKRVAPLMMVEVGSYVDMVGYRVAPNCFFVYADA